MKTLLTESDRHALMARIGNLVPGSKPIAGTLTAPRMLCHIADQIAVALGDIAGSQQDTWVMRTLAKWFVLYAPIRIPFGKVKTVPEMLTTEPTDWENDQARFRSLVARFSGADHVSPHTVFGKLSHREWGILAAKHIDHHLRQFGA
jgi:Protein of unknown function (DUF1569)